MTVLWKDGLFKDLPVVSHKDHPLSLGYTTVLCCRHPLMDKKSRCSKAAREHLKAAMPSSSGLSLSWDRNKVDMIFIDHVEDGKLIPLGRVVELVAHEVSHNVDYVLDRTCLKRVDTELRAYYIDWLVGKVLHHFPSLWKDGN